MLCLDQKMTAYYKTNFLVWSLFLSANISFAQPINYQGRLSDKSGTNVNGTKNFALRIFDAKTGEMLGAHMIGAEVTEMIQGYTVARSLETTEVELMHTVFPHPTLSEMMHESVLDAYGRAVHF